MSFLALLPMRRPRGMSVLSAGWSREAEAMSNKRLSGRRSAGAGPQGRRRLLENGAPGTGRGI